MSAHSGGTDAHTITMSTHAEGTSTEQDAADKAAVAEVLAGNRNAFRAIVVRYEPAVRALGRRLLHDEQAADDLVQDVFLKAFRRLETYNGSGRFYSWLMRMAYTTGLNARNRKPPEHPVDPATLLSSPWASTEAGPEDQAIRREAERTLERAISRLPERYALAVELFFRLNLGYREIEAMTGIPVGTLKSHVYRARKLLKDSLTDTIAEDYHAV